MSAAADKFADRQSRRRRRRSRRQSDTTRREEDSAAAANFSPTKSARQLCNGANEFAQPTLRDLKFVCMSRRMADGGVGGRKRVT